mmetsp:Transcript_50898/g.108735  ORF Transcript_50898/g.108735 Transcript_50898/m.108735 type:complete len:230 (-) Transcript_50898:848-1537(-)
MYASAGGARALCVTSASPSHSRADTTRREPTRSPSSTSPASGSARSPTCQCCRYSGRPRAASSCRSLSGEASRTWWTSAASSTPPSRWPTPTSAPEPTRSPSAPTPWMRLATGLRRARRQAQPPSSRSRLCMASRQSSCRSTLVASGWQTRQRLTATRSPISAATRHEGQTARRSAGTSALCTAGVKAAGSTWCRCHVRWSASVAASCSSIASTKTGRTTALSYRSCKC